MTKKKGSHGEQESRETERDLQDDSKGLTSVLKFLEVHSTFERRR